eukprot:scaffold928_cov370-Prasinococcus_capsulatus_cf.AAC.16
MPARSKNARGQPVTSRCTGTYWRDHTGVALVKYLCGTARPLLSREGRLRAGSPEKGRGAGGGRGRGVAMLEPGVGWGLQ